MAYDVSASLAVDDATPKVGQSRILTLTVDNSSGTVDMTVTGIRPFLSNPAAPCQMGQPTPTELMAGTADTPAGTAVAAGNSATFKWPITLPVAGAVSVLAQVLGTRSDTGASIPVLVTSGVTVTAS